MHFNDITSVIGEDAFSRSTFQPDLLVEAVQTYLHADRPGEPPEGAEALIEKIIGDFRLDPAAEAGIDFKPIPDVGQAQSLLLSYLHLTLYDGLQDDVDGPSVRRALRVLPDSASAGTALRKDILTAVQEMDSAEGLVKSIAARAEKDGQFRKSLEASRDCFAQAIEDLNRSFNGLPPGAQGKSLSAAAAAGATVITLTVLCPGWFFLLCILVFIVVAGVLILVSRRRRRR
ncbi:hypothetical protein LGQ03_09120 [Loktanella sp. TSTF-M6]|uniref:Uncharacterized protein n=1 Tax=Loktanella gaetbuli TaxID=2881335 RepID=A0ABS8BUR0_9RHOB|nr:hypothetical protein [Loktanella gaetbuli]MCB5199402.1 hypothetical protein [Loktanella gaetbuli]